MHAKRLLCLSTFMTMVTMNFVHSDSYDAEDKCRVCKDITEAFKKGVGETDKANFGGGNTHWEEKSLGSYATSETRFLEIVEKLCKDAGKESRCHQMVEEYEERLEDYWFKKFSKQRHVDDLLRWFCIERAKVCCPKNTYGPKCVPCTGGSERPCFGNGNCNGEGTRGGTGKCDCNSGYQGDKCDSCKDGYFEENKNETHLTCTECHKSCKSTCWEGGPKGCDECKEGWTNVEEKGCTDIDECEENPCSENEYCENTEGSHNCNKCDSACSGCTGSGADNCVECSEGFTKEENTCKDIDECSTLEVCKGEHETCKNTAGSYSCECEDEYTMKEGVCVVQEKEDPKPDTKDDQTKTDKNDTSKQEDQDDDDDDKDANSDDEMQNIKKDEL